VRQNKTVKPLRLFQNCSRRREEAHFKVGNRMKPPHVVGYGILKGRGWSAILFSLVLAWTQLSAAPVPATPARPAHACCHCGGKMSCCTASAPVSQSAPAVPSNAGPQKQLPISAPDGMAGALPENRVALIGGACRLSVRPAAAPLYARDCARLI
jgi:hypothetical protein